MKLRHQYYVMLCMGIKQICAVWHIHGMACASAAQSTQSGLPVQLTPDTACTLLAMAA